MTYNDYVQAAFFDELQKISSAQKEAGVMDLARKAGKAVKDTALQDVGGKRWLLTPRSPVAPSVASAATKTVRPLRRAAAAPRMARVL